MVKSDWVWILVSSVTGWMIWANYLISLSQTPLLWNGNDGSVDLRCCGESLRSWWSPYLAQCPAHPQHSVSVGSSCYCWWWALSLSALQDRWTMQLQGPPSHWTQCHQCGHCYGVVQEATGSCSPPAQLFHSDAFLGMCSRMVCSPHSDLGL